jgi:hypothetical protein
MSDPLWAIVPVLNNPAMTEQALLDILGQSIPTRVLIVAQGVDDPLREQLERFCERHSDRAVAWFWDPRMPSLSRVWNLACEFVWASGGTEAWVCNNDIRVHARTADVLRTVLYLPHREALFVSAVGVMAHQFDPLVLPPIIPHINVETVTIPELNAGLDQIAHGGPDFSCFLISKACHATYRWDEAFIPAHTEDLDFHRRLMLAGDGDRIFSINLPFLHHAAQTLKAMSEDERARTNRQIASVCRAHYRAKWGGDVNQETFWTPFDAGTPDVNLPMEVISAIEQPTTPALQAALKAYYEGRGGGPDVESSVGMF